MTVADILALTKAGFTKDEIMQMCKPEDKPKEQKPEEQKSEENPKEQKSEEKKSDQPQPDIMQEFVEFMRNTTATISAMQKQNIRNDHATEPEEETPSEAMLFMRNIIIEE